MITLHHSFCQDSQCRTCLKDHLDLGDELGERSGVTRVDHLGQYKRWFGDQEIEDETEWGWVCPLFLKNPLSRDTYVKYGR